MRKSLRTNPRLWGHPGSQYQECTRACGGWQDGIGQTDINISAWTSYSAAPRGAGLNRMTHVGDRVVCTATYYTTGINACTRTMASLGSGAAANAVTTTLDPVPSPSLQDRIQTLTDVHSRLQTLRHVPPMLLRPPSASPLADFPPPFDPTIDREFAVTFNSTPAHDFRALKDFLEVLCCDKVQEALRAARASEDADQSELGLSFRRENRKRKYVCTSGLR
jgi:hypothetical protein